MDHNNQWEYDYSNIYNTTPGANPQTPQGTHSAYANVGSSGTNTANETTTEPTGRVNGLPYTQAQPDAAYGAQTQHTPHYQQSTHGQARAKRHKRSMGKTVAMRTLELTLVAAIGFGAGFVGSQYGAKSTGNGAVVVQMMARDMGETENISTSTYGADLSLSQVSAIVSPSVVVITTEQMVATSNWYGGQNIVSGAGSGVIISEDGYILTCNHVIEDSTNIIVTIEDEDYTAHYIGGDVESDVAVIKIEATGLTAAVLGDSDALSVGETVVAVGNPLGELGGTVTNGIVSALNRSIYVEEHEMSLIQTNASVSPGNSGGGLFNMAGELIGIVNAKSKDSDSEGLGFAIPVNTAFTLAQSLIENGYITGRPELGVTAITINDMETAMQLGVNAYGVYIYAVNDQSAAQAAGIEPGDRIISVDGTEIAVLDDLTNAIGDHAVGDVISVSVARDGQITTLEVKLGEKGSTEPTMPEESLQQGSSKQPETEGDSMNPEENAAPENNLNPGEFFINPFR